MSAVTHGKWTIPTGIKWNGKFLIYPWRRPWEIRKGWEMMVKSMSCGSSNYVILSWLFIYGPLRRWIFNFSCNSLEWSAFCEIRFSKYFSDAYSNLCLESLVPPPPKRKMLKEEEKRWLRLHFPLKYHVTTHCFYIELRKPFEVRESAGENRGSTSPVRSECNP